VADQVLAPGVRYVSVPVADGSGKVQAAIKVMANTAETSMDTLLGVYLPLFRDAAEKPARTGPGDSPAPPHLGLTRAWPLEFDSVRTYVKTSVKRSCVSHIFIGMRIDLRPLILLRGGEDL
jgi:hypothetical protein